MALPRTSLGPHCLPAPGSKGTGRGQHSGCYGSFSPGLASMCSASLAPQGTRSLVVQELDPISNPITELPDVLGDMWDKKPFLTPSQVLLEGSTDLLTGGVKRNPHQPLAYSNDGRFSDQVFLLSPCNFYHLAPVLFFHALWNKSHKSLAFSVGSMLSTDGRFRSVRRGAEVYFH